MIKSLRKQHLRIWVLLAALLPVGIICALMNVPKQPHQKVLQPGTSKVLPVVLKSVDQKNYRVSIRVNLDTTEAQLEWINKKISTLPSSLIYNISGKANELIGRVEGTGSYYFPLSTDSVQVAGYGKFILYDIIHQQAIDSIKF
jgi:hypothetical protein